MDLAREVLLPIYKKEAVHEFDPLLFSTHRPEPLFQRGGSSQRILVVLPTPLWKCGPEPGAAFSCEEEAFSTQHSAFSHADGVLNAEC